MVIINENVLYPYSVMEDYETKFNLSTKHDEMLSLLQEFDKFCRTNDINYSLADGTLLGALRHSDFIPWDDDADVMVTRDEYNKIRAVLNNESNVKLLKIHFLDRVTTTEYEKKKVYIDLFINEDMPSNKLIFEWKKFKTRFLRTYFVNDKVRNIRHDKYNTYRKVIYNTVNKLSNILAKCIVGKRDVFELNDSAVSIKKHKSSGIYTRYTSRMYETKRRFDIDSYNAGYDDVMFRGTKLMAIKNADSWLHEMYGDYMILLPEDKRKPEHPVNMLDSPESCIKRYN